jgi:hypothetical protein
MGTSCSNSPLAPAKERTPAIQTRMVKAAHNLPKVCWRKREKMHKDQICSVLLLAERCKAKLSPVRLKTVPKHQAKVVRQQSAPGVITPSKRD